MIDQSHENNRTPGVTHKWKEVNVFISSTFSNMRAERDHLVKVVFPELREKLERHRIHLMDIDLRWGVTREQAENNEVVEYCLDQVDACRPFFIGILGERWGWTPKEIPENVLEKFPWIARRVEKSQNRVHESAHRSAESGTYGQPSVGARWSRIVSRVKALAPWIQKMHPESLSLAAMEIHHGVFQNSGKKSHAFFYFRDPAFLEDVPPGIRSEIYEKRDEGAREKLVQLKREIRGRGIPVMDGYPCRWDPDRISPEDGTKGRVAGLEAFGERVKADLWRAFRDEFDLSEAKEEAVGDEAPMEFSALEGDGWLDEEMDHHLRFIESRLRIYVGRKKLRDSLMAYVDGKKNTPFLVTGPPGCGKSTALGRFYNEYVSMRPGDLVIPHFVGASPRSTSLSLTLRRFRDVLTTVLGLEAEAENDPRMLSYDFNTILQKASTNKRILILIDGVNQLDESEIGLDLAWLPRELPENVKIIMSCIDDSNREIPFLTELRKRGIPETRVEPLDRDERLEIIEKVPSLAAKTLDQEQVALLLAKPGTKNPLYLQVALEELRGFGSFERLNHRIYRLPNGLNDLFRQVIERMEEDWSETVVNRTLSMLAASRNGLRERELADLTKDIDENDELFVILRQLRPYLLKRGPFVDFYHRSLFKAVKSHCLQRRQETLKAHRDLAGYFLEQGSRSKGAPWEEADGHALSELRLHLFQGEMWDELERTLTDAFFLEACVRKGQLLELLSDMRTALSVLPKKRPYFRLLTLLEKALNRDAGFISRNPDAMFQTIYNRCFWHDAETAREHYQTSRDLKGESQAWKHPKQGLAELMADWREKRATFSGGPWIRSHRPPVDPLESSLVTVLDASMYGQSNPIKRVAVSKDRRLIAAGSQRAELFIWLVETGELVESFDLGRGEIAWLGFLDSDSVLLAVAMGEIPFFLDLQTMKEVGPETAFRTGKYVAMDEEGRWIAQGWGDGEVKLWQGLYDRSPRTFSNHRADVSAVALSVESDLLASGCRDGVIVVRTLRAGDIIWDANLLEAPLFDWEHRWSKDMVLNLAFSPDGKRLAAVYVNFGLCLLDSLTGDLRWRFCHEDGPGYRTVAFHPDGKTLAIGCDDGSVEIRDVETKALILKKEGHQDYVNDLAFAADGQWFISGSSDGQVRLWRMAEEVKDRPKRKDHGGRIGRIVFSPNGKLLASGNWYYPTEVIVWDVYTGLPIHELSCPSDVILELAFDDDSRLLAAGGEGGVVWIWDMKSGRLVNEYDVDLNKLYEISFGRKGTRILTESFGDKIRLWDVHKGTRLLDTKKDITHGHALQPGDDARCLASLFEGSAFIWDMESGKMVQRIQPTRGAFQSAAFCPTGRYMGLGTSTGYTCIIHLEQGFKRYELSCFDDSVDALAFNGDGSLLLVFSGSMGFARLISVENQTILGDLETAGTWRAYWDYLDSEEKKKNPPPVESFRKKVPLPWRVGFSPDGGFVGMQLGSVGSILYDSKTFKIVDMDQSHPCCSNFYAGPLHSRWIMDMKEREIILYDHTTGKEAACYPGPYERMYCSPADPAVFAAYKGKRVEIFSVSVD